MGGAGRGQASVEWIAAALVALALVAALGVGVRGSLDAGAVLRQALGALHLVEEPPPRPPSPPAYLVRGAPGDPVLGRAIRGAAQRSTAAASAGVGIAGPAVLRAGRDAVRATGRQGAAFVRGFRGRLEEILAAWTSPPTLRSAARKALNGLWEATPYAQVIRNAISGGRIAIAGVRGRSLTAATEQAGREAADRVVGYLLGRARERLGGKTPRPRRDGPGSRTRRSSGADGVPRP